MVSGNCFRRNFYDDEKGILEATLAKSRIFCKILCCLFVIIAPIYNYTTKIWGFEEHIIYIRCVKSTTNYESEDAELRRVTLQLKRYVNTQIDMFLSHFKGFVRVKLS